MAERIFLAPVVFLEMFGVGRYFYRGAEVPDEGLDQAEVKKLESLGHIGTREVEGGEPIEIDIPEGTPNTKWSVAQVDAYATREGIDLSDAKTKADKLAIISASTEPDEGTAPDPGITTVATGDIQ